MLDSLIIKNCALIEEAEIDFGDCLNIISGETGAGKSIIINSISFLLGQKPNADFIRTGED
ncbi:MAG: AAA family ATPase, partial [Clostridiales bacterium]|nr:AAA family ATPase [Clostridiales bacterium]